MVRRNLHPNAHKVPANFCRLPDGYGVVKIGVSGAADTGSAAMNTAKTPKARSDIGPLDDPPCPQ